MPHFYGILSVPVYKLAMYRLKALCKHLIYQTHRIWAGNDTVTIPYGNLCGQIFQRPAKLAENILSVVAKVTVGKAVGAAVIGPT